MYKTDLLSEELLVSYLNQWNKLGCDLEEFERKEIAMTADILEKARFREIEKYAITPYEVNFIEGGSMTAGGVIKVLVPFKYCSVVNSEFLRKSFKTIYQTSSWKIEMHFGILDVCLSMLYKYILKFVDSSIEAVSHLNLKQKIQKVFRDAVKSGTMDVVFYIDDSKVTILRKYMNEFHTYNSVQFTGDEVMNFKNMLIGVIGGVEAVRVDAEPSLDFKIENLNEDGKYEGRANFMRTKTGYQFHIRIIKLEFNVMTLNDYPLMPPIKQEVLESLEQTTGLILVTGPRGSGKQVFLYSCINEFIKKRPKVFIETLEDPVEARLDGNIAQIEIDKSNGYDFVYYLRGIKRHSTNLYMIGELRDRETVEAALTEASSAALIMTTTHCSDCAGVLKKMSMELKDDDSTLVKLINEFKVVTNLTMTKKACPKCRREVSFDELTRAEKKFVESWNYGGKIYKQTDEGCDFCRALNYRKINKYSSDGNLYEPLIVVESLSFDIDVMEIVNQYDSVTLKEKALREYMIKNGRYKAQIALSLVNSGSLNLEECMRHFSTNVYTSH
jgi:type II secretory ATPase GspE/PulE/Tfp pilus assembly ATPase PilB-like protein